MFLYILINDLHKRLQMKDPVFTLFFQLMTWAISDSTHNILLEMFYGHWLGTSLSLYDRKDLGKSKKQKLKLNSSVKTYKTLTGMQK